MDENSENREEGENNNQSESKIHSIVWGDDGCLYIGTTDNEVHLLDPATLSPIAIYTSPEKYTIWPENTQVTDIHLAHGQTIALSGMADNSHIKEEEDEETESFLPYDEFLIRGRDKEWDIDHFGSPIPIKRKRFIHFLKEKGGLILIIIGGLIIGFFSGVILSI